jgi:citrate synthase
MLTDPEQKIARPRQIYTGHEIRQLVPMEQRAAAFAHDR